MGILECGVQTQQSLRISQQNEGAKGIFYSWHKIYFFDLLHRFS